MKFHRDISVAGGLPMKSVGSKPQARLPSLQYQSQNGTQITSSCEKHQEFYLPGRDSWRPREPLKEPTQKNLICSHLPWALAEKNLGLVALGTEGTTVRIPVLGHSPYCRRHYTQAEDSSPNGTSLRGSKSPTHRNYSVVLKPCC